MALNSIQFHDFDSTRVDEAWWSPDTEHLDVRFPDGNMARYHRVDARTWQAFITAPSAGAFLNDVLTVNHRYESI